MASIETVLPGSTVRTTLGSLGAAGVYLIRSGEDRILYDTGHPGRKKILFREMGKLKINFKDVNYVVISHLHWDHALNVSLFNSSKIIIDKKELEEDSEDEYPRVSLLSDYIRQLDVRYVSNGTKIADANEVSVISSPGHTAGHISLAVRTGEAVDIITGDSLPNARAMHRGEPDLIFFDKRAAINSVKAILSYKPGIIYPGHDSPFSLEPQLTYLSEIKFGVTYRTEGEEDYDVVFSREPSKKSYF
ncbi:MAG: MBL fold metallo-hydrolase [Candidatus Thermoplasmatota archaeon]|nr:MBL fold metallo-hydrolase [Candidatus Thermoplasmatota archaeon]